MQATKREAAPCSRSRLCELPPLCLCFLRFCPLTPFTHRVDDRFSRHQLCLATHLGQPLLGVHCRLGLEVWKPQETRLAQKQ